MTTSSQDADTTLELEHDVTAAQPGSDDERGTGSADAELCQFVSFTVGREEYAVDIMQVREIKGWTEVTLLPNQPAHMRGVLNLRGIIVPIVDLRCRFGQGETEATATHVVVIVALGERVIGILVDTVSDILTVSRGEIRDVPDMDAREDQDFLLGLVTSNERMVAILDLGRLVSSADLSTTTTNASAA